MALPHAESELLELAAHCVSTNAREINSWDVEDWVLDQDDVDRAIATYTALLRGDTDPDADDILAGSGLVLDDLLLNRPKAVHKVTRADVVELIAAAYLIEEEGWPLDTMHMPNIPKMARGKSDSGIDVMSVQLGASPVDELSDDDRLWLASVKHTIRDASDLRYKIITSLMPGDLSPVYVASQLKVLNAHLILIGMPRHVSKRIWMFLRNWPNFAHVDIVGVAGVDPRMQANFETQLEDNAPEVDAGTYQLRVLIIPGLWTLHEQCP